MPVRAQREIQCREPLVAVRAQGMERQFSRCPRRFWCRACATRYGRRVRPLRLEPVAWEKGVIELQMPDEREWKRALRRFRT
jgi:hypothetical protein